MRVKPKKANSFLCSRNLIFFGIAGLFFYIFPSLLLVISIIAIVLGIMLYP